MENERTKTPADSYTEQVQILTQGSLNGYNRLFGGQLMEWIDIVAAVAARRHAERNVTTAVVDMLRFRKPAYANDMLVIAGKVTYVGNTSMEVRVDTYVESRHGGRDLINTAYIVMVALDEHDKPVRVPRLALTSDEERAEWERALLRNERRRHMDD